MAAENSNLIVAANATRQVPACAMMNRPATLHIVLHQRAEVTSVIDSAAQIQISGSQSDDVVANSNTQQHPKQRLGPVDISAYGWESAAFIDDGRPDVNGAAELFKPSPTIISAVAAIARSPGLLPSAGPISKYAGRPRSRQHESHAITGKMRGNESEKKNT